MYDRRRQPVQPVRVAKVLVCGICGKQAVLKKCCKSGNYGYACPEHGFVELRTVLVRV
jgi:predicted RNA-binding Zn-ribbon protein involved in translation (DUF1610 family)